MKKQIQLSDLDQRRKRMILGTSNALAVALELVAKNCGHAVARSIKIQAIMDFRQMSDEDVDRFIVDLEVALSTRPNATGVYASRPTAKHSQN